MPTAATTDQDKPFKTIEVVDAQTKQVCKVACMSCIRGHRTTSCGIPVCRNKVFWTVKRPGRPSNACNCRYGSTGGCRCVVASAAACPHKAKKGEKRGGECRCDEQGRYCCLIEGEHWAVLMELGKPEVVFFQKREDLESRFSGAATASGTPMSPPGFASMGPTTFESLPSTPMQQAVSPYAGYQSPRSILAPRFGMMGLGTPHGDDGTITPDVLLWEGLSPPAPQEQSSCCQGAASPSQPSTYLSYMEPTTPSNHNLPSFLSPTGTMDQPPNQLLDPLPRSQQEFSFNLDKLNSAYAAYQFPSAICQTCGLNGCTCRNCPPVMQNFATGSWAQCCGRKHARTAAYVPVAVEHVYGTPAPIPAPTPATVQHAPVSEGLTPIPQRELVDGVPGQQVFALAPPRPQPAPVPVPRQSQQHQRLPEQAPQPYYQEQLFTHSARPASVPDAATPHPAPHPDFFLGIPGTGVPSRQPHTQPQHRNKRDRDRNANDGLPDLMPFDPGEDFELDCSRIEEVNGVMGPELLDEWLLHEPDGHDDHDEHGAASEGPGDEGRGEGGGGCCCGD
ncbi:hypothetical protein LTR62_001559 [Meristemomyces frigidus]|uniref:Copper-fist domain-containing protein n=1 Tax=Meristemomyces frigidus TaxID=1508187 RepID=A0AAN7YQL9_9PEZI|nr:hypothetical protein LTR62_001559 [Meristemomyces frigidus]